MSTPEDFIGAEIEQLKETIRAFGRGDIVPITDKDAEIERLQARLDMIADIAEGSTTADSLPHIAKIACGVEPCPDHPTGCLVDDDGRRICATCGRH